MKTLRLRQLATPLKEARARDPMIEKAALFVEKLFGRPMRSDPHVLIIDSSNKDALIRVLKEDMPNAMLFNPFSFLYPKDNLRKLNEELMAQNPRATFETFGSRDMLCPIQAVRRVRETLRSGGIRAVFEEVAEVDDPTFLQRIARPFIAGVQFENLGMVVTTEGNVPVVLVHELIHAEDSEIYGGIKGRFGLLLAEGRATFGEMLFTNIHREEHGPVKDLYDDSLPFHLRILLQRWRGTLRKMGELGPAGSARWLKSFYDYTVRRTGLKYQMYYLPFAIQLNGLSRQVGNAFTAFQMATERPPETLRQALRLKEYYGDELRNLGKG